MGADKQEDASIQDVKVDDDSSISLFIDQLQHLASLAIAVILDQRTSE